VVEGFASELLERATLEALGTWEFPRCAVSLPDGAIAVAAGYPSEDGEVLADWAARVAKAAALRGVRRAFVDGAPQPCDALAEAFDVVGIAVVLAAR
jgi:hypothetical protein